MNNRIIIILLALFSLAITSCTSPKQLKKTLEENPDIIFNVIEKHPERFLTVLKKAAQEAEAAERKNAQKKEEEQFEQEFKNPRKPEVDDSRVFIGGSKSAPITIVEYSDFLCYYCAKAHGTMKGLKEKYGDKIRILYKHLPFKPGARLASQYFEAISQQSHEKAEKFHDILFQNQKTLSGGGEQYLKKVAKQVGANLSKIASAIKSDEVQKRISSDEQEASKFEFRGTPGFLVNGVTVRGAYPPDHFEKIIDRHLKNN